MTTRRQLLCAATALSATLGTALNQRVLVENKPGGGGFIAIDAVKRAASDGYTLLQLDSEHLAALQHLYKARGLQSPAHHQAATVRRDCG